MGFFFPSALFYVFKLFLKKMLEDEGHEWEERKEGREEGASLTSCSMTHPGRQPVAPCGSWVLIGDSLSQATAPWVVSAAAAWVMRVPHLG